MKNLIITTILVCVTSLLIAEQIAIYNTPSSEYCIRIIDNDGDVWDKDANSFSVSGYTDANGFTNLTEDGNTPGRYYATFPPEISAGTYDVLVYDSNVTDVNAVTDYDGGFAYDWDGSSEVTEQMIVADTNELQTDWTDDGQLDLILDDIPNTSEFNARTLLSADYFDFTVDIADSNVTQIDGDTNSVTRLKNRR